jgi:hypothetical protein
VRRRAPAASSRIPALPPEAAAHYVEDWVSVAEIAMHTWTESCPPCTHREVNGHRYSAPADCEFYLEFTALRRWEAVRIAWLAENDIPLPAQCGVWPFRRPVWRATPRVGSRTTHRGVKHERSAAV